MTSQLAAQDIKLLMEAESVILSSHEGEYSSITCHKDGKPYHVLTVPHLILDNEGGDLPDLAVLFIDNIQSEDVWRSILAVLEPEDCLKIRWCRGTYTSPAMLPYNLAGDAVEIEVDGEERRLVFLLLVHVAEKGSKTRIFQHLRADA